LTEHVKTNTRVLAQAGSECRRLVALPPSVYDGAQSMKTQCLLAVLVPSLWLFRVAVFGQKQNCPEFSGAVKTRVEKRARWLVSESLQQQVAQKSRPLGHLIAFEQCHALVSGVLSDGFTTVEGPHFLDDGIPLKSVIARNQSTRMMAVAPAEADGKMPDPNLLELTEHNWTLFYRDKRGKKTAVATGKY
jgi:hypothetical protein